MWTAHMYKLLAFSFQEILHRDSSCLCHDSRDIVRGDAVVQHAQWAFGFLVTRVLVIG